MSPFKKGSELNLINQQAAKAPLKISIEMFYLIQKSIEISKLSQGAFDITFSSVGQFYDYKEKRTATTK